MSRVSASGRISASGRTTDSGRTTSSSRPPMIVNPLSDAGLLVWLDPTSTITNAAGNPAVNGDSVKQWNDLSPNANHAVQPTGGSQPTYSTSAWGGGQSCLILGPSTGAGDTNYFNLTTPLTNVVSGYIEIYDNKVTQSRVVILGSGTFFDFAGAASGPMLDPTFASVNIINGSTFLNGILNPTISIPRPLFPASFSFIGVGNLRVGNISFDRLNAGRCWTGPIRRVVLSSTTWTPSYINGLINYFQSVSASPTYLNRTVVGIGNSITLGQGAIPGTNDYPTQMIASIPNGTLKYKLQNQGVSGQTTTQELALESTYNSFGGYNRIALISEITNDIYFDVLAATTQPASVYFGRYKQLVMDMTNFGFNCMTTTVLPRSNSPMTSPQIATQEALRVACNALIRSDSITNAHLADWAADPNMGTLGQETNTIYYSGDNVHPNANGYTRLASICSPIFLNL